jgi:hypothetical protein
MTPSMAEKANDLVQRIRSYFGSRVAPYTGREIRGSARWRPASPTRLQDGRKYIKNNGLEAFKSDPNVGRFGTGNLVLEKGKTLEIEGVWQVLSHGTSIALYASNVVFES